MTSYWSWEALQRRERWRLCLILLQKSRLFCCCTGTTSANTSFSGWYIERLGRQNNRRSHSTSLPHTSWCWSSKAGSASTDSPPRSLQGGHQQPITQKSAGEESLKPQLCCTIYFCDSQKLLGSILPWKLQIPGISAPRTGGKGCSGAAFHVVAPYSRHSDTSTCLSGARNLLLGLINSFQDGWESFSTVSQASLAIFTNFLESTTTIR